MTRDTTEASRIASTDEYDREVKLQFRAGQRRRTSDLFPFLFD